LTHSPIAVVIAGADLLSWAPFVIRAVAQRTAEALPMVPDLRLAHGAGELQIPLHGGRKMGDVRFR
jgi:hypothetical protein